MIRTPRIEFQVFEYEERTLILRYETLYALNSAPFAGPYE